MTGSDRPRIRATWGAALVCLALGGCSSAHDPLPALGTLERDRLELTAEAGEPVVGIAVREGEHVEAGQVLLQLDSANSSARLKGLQAQVGGAQRQLDELVSGARAEEILQARARVEAAESVAQNATREYQRVRELLERRLVSQSAVDQQRTSSEAADAGLKEARAQLTLLLKGTRSEALDRARDDLTRAQAEQEQAAIGASRLTVRAPRAGTIESLPFKLGSRPPAGSPVVVMLADGQPYARIYVPELLRANISAGTAAQVHVDGKPQAFAGTVRFISSEAAFTPYFALTQKDRGRLSYLAEVVLTEAAAAQLPAGIPVEVTFSP